ncbi:GGDEF domain-containing protein [Legionella sp. km772]|uniref:GGDEF domain-containing protein n=1 Tax=Legionella sp. km772 TaxID=2498111 RepID=UPI002101786C|nr:GGDEF domain-containing protein [Legionella sp. km772]
MTSLPNRESYDEYIAEALQRWHESGKHLSLAVGDIDHFKFINDTFGHLAGDKVLKKVASIFKSSVRDTDYIARYGGEEFVLIFEDTSSKEALSMIEKLRKSVKDCQFAYRDNKVDVTVSFGLTTIVKGDNIESLFIRADTALYKAKDAGRNRCAVL